MTQDLIWTAAKFGIGAGFSFATAMWLLWHALDYGPAGFFVGFFMFSVGAFCMVGVCRTAESAPFQKDRRQS